MGGAGRYLEGEGFFSESQVLGGHKAGQEDVDAFSNAEGHSHHPVRSRLAVQAADEVRQVIQHCQIVLHHNHVLLLPQKPSNDLAK